MHRAVWAGFGSRSEHGSRSEYGHFDVFRLTSVFSKKLVKRVGQCRISEVTNAGDNLATRGSVSVCNLYGYTMLH
jgi:hypothetical protein